MKRNIRQNIWGNWNGYEGTRKVKEFGCGVRGEMKAKDWIEGLSDEPSNNPNLTVLTLGKAQSS